METKLFEIRDVATFIPVIAIRISEADGFLARKMGYGKPMVLVIKEPIAHYDPYDWGNRTMSQAHMYIQKNWKALESGAVIDVEFILGITAQPKTSEGA